MSLGGSSNDPEKLGSCVKILSWLRKKRSMRVHFWRYVPFLHYVSCFFPKRPVNLHPLLLFSKHELVCDPEKNWVQNMGRNKQGAKKQGYCYSKREEAKQKTGSLLLKKSLHLLFLSNNVPVFCTLLFAAHILDPFLISGQPDKLE